MRRALAAACVLLLALTATTAAEEAGDADLLAGVQAAAHARALVGSWSAQLPEAQVPLLLREDGSFRLATRSGTWSVPAPGRLRLGTEAGTDDYAVAFDKGQLVLSGGALQQPLQFQRRPEMGNLLSWAYREGTENAVARLTRIGVIIAIVLGAQLVIALLGVASHVLVYSERGVLRRIYRHNKNRAVTIHSIVLNTCKYVVYGVAFGFVLSELGIDYMTYIASLSVIGLAVGFGSQGLVQDMVTGLFIIFENQFDVGDVIDLAGQTGVVQEVGLRMTKLRTYQGQTVTIPNRSIGVVARYRPGGLEATVDIAAADAEAVERAGAAAREVADQVARQFAGAVLLPPRLAEPVALDSGPRFARLQIGIWPGQQWLIDQQLVPRLRERLKAADIAIPHDRVTVFYRPSEQAERPALPEGMRRFFGMGSP